MNDANNTIKFVNLTPHAVVFQAADGSRRTFEPSGKVARVTSKSIQVGEVDGIPLIEQVFGEVTDLPATQRWVPGENVFYIVSGMVLAAMSGGTNVIAPATGPNDGAIRNAAGQIEAVTRFVRCGRAP